MADMTLLIGRSLLLLASFAGLCAGLRLRFKLDCCIAPFTAASCIIAVLMLGGMLGALVPAVCALYLLGLAGFVYAYCVKKSFAPPVLYLSAVAFIAFLIWRFYFCPLYRNDDVSHWALVARHLLNHNRFPVGRDTYVYFQSYPLGVACFIYYIGRLTLNAEGVYLVAHNLLLGLLFLPMFSLIRERRKVFLPIAAALFFFLFHFFRTMISLQVDIILSFFGIGAAAAIARYRADARRAVIAALPAMIAVVCIKNSGLFFSAASAAMLWYVFRRSGLRRPGWRALAAFAVSALTYLLWIVHIKLRFPAALETKHAVSIAAYLSELRTKGLSLALQITKLHMQMLITPRIDRNITYVFILMAAVVLFFSTRALPVQRRRRLYRLFVAAIALYLIWYILILLMYIFSMPEEEALVLASHYRYNGTGLAYLIGLISILLFVTLQQTGALASLMRWVGRLCPLYIAAMIALTAIPNPLVGRFKMFERDLHPYSLHDACEEAKEVCDLEDGCRLLVYWRSRGREQHSYVYAYYALKYEFESDELFMIFDDSDEPAEYFLAHNRNVSPLEDAAEYAADMIDSCEAFLIMNESSEFEDEIAAFLDGYGGDTLVYRAYSPKESASGA